MAHCDRLTRSVQAFHWRAPDWSAIRSGCQHLKGHYPVLRITLFPDGTEWITGRGLPPQLAQQQQQGVICWQAPPTYARSLPTHKTGNYLACTLARQQAQAHGACEAILTNPQGHCLETATGNLWGWAKGQWWTPVSSEPGSECLPGIMRAQLQQLLLNGGEQVNTQPWDLSQLQTFEAIAYSNCVVELLPIRTVLIDTYSIGFDPHHPKIKSLQQLTQMADSC